MAESYDSVVHSGFQMVKLAGLQMRNGHTRFTDVVHLEQPALPYGGWSVTLCGRTFAPGTYYFVMPRDSLGVPQGRVWRPCRQCYHNAHVLRKQQAESKWEEVKA